MGRELRRVVQFNLNRMPMTPKTECAPPGKMLNSQQTRARPALLGLMDNWYLLKMMMLGDLRSQHIGSVLGGLWFVVKPIVLIGIYTIVFSAAAKSVGALQGQSFNYGLFIFAGMLPWLSVQESTQRGSTIIVDLAQLVRHHVMPLGLLPLHVVLAVTLSQGIAVLVFLLIKWMLTGHISPFALLIIVVFPIQIVFCFGLALVVSIMNVFLRDISHFTTTALIVWFFASPIVFPLDRFSGFLSNIIWLNPMTGLTQIYRDLLLVGRLPSPLAVGTFVLSAALLVVAGLGLYRRTHDAIVDWI
jgi:lipopolysaccharide transport system permease protein